MVKATYIWSKDIYVYFIGGKGGGVLREEEKTTEKMK